MAAVGAALAFLLTRIPNEPLPASSPASGTLVYASEVGSARGGQRLWRLDLATGRVAPGPRVPAVEELLSAPGAGPGWMVLTALPYGGTRRAYVLHGTTSADRPVALGSGHLVAWGPSGLNVVIARRGPRRDRCHRDVAVDLVSVKIGSREPEFRQQLCGDVLSVGRDAVITYFTRLSNGHLGIYYAGYKVAHPVLGDYALVAVSPEGYMLATPEEILTRRVFPGSRGRASVRPRHVSGVGTVLYWRGRGGPIPLSDGRDTLLVRRLLAWSPDAASALVVANAGHGPGVFEVRVVLGRPRADSSLVAEVTGPTGATFSADGVAYLVLDQRLFAYADGQLSPIPLPDGAPPPSGPIAWTL